MNCKPAYICSDCINDSYLKSIVLDSGSLGICSFCQSAKVCTDLDQIIPPIYKCFSSHLIEAVDEELIFNPKTCKLEYARLGQTLIDILLDTAVDDSEVAEMIVTRLTELEAESGGVNGNCILDESAEYNLFYDGGSHLYGAWRDFCEIIRHHSRFTATEEHSILGELISWLIDYRTTSGETLLVSVEKGDEVVSLYRGRKVHSNCDILNAYKNPEQFFSAPSNEKATAGRMNPEGIPYLYAAFGRETCVAELRAEVGGKVITAELKPTRSLQLLDLTKVTREYLSDKSTYHPEHFKEQGIRDFLFEFRRLISQPVQKENSIDYVPTQVVVEYIARKYLPFVDGMIYSSSQGSQLADNVVFFERASRMVKEEGFSLPYAESEVQLMPDYCIVYERENEKQSKTFPALHLPDSILDRMSSQTFTIPRESLRLHEVEGISHNISMRKVIPAEPEETLPDISLKDLL